MFGRKKGDREPGEVAEAPVELGPGPYDADVIDLEDGVERLDLGAILLPPIEGRELRLQVDEATQQVQSVLVAGPDGAVELKPFAAPRNGDLWAEIWPQIADDMRRRGGQVEEREGPHGVELVGAVPVDMGDGQPRVQPSRIIGVNGPRWLLRATFLGKPAVEPDGAEEWYDVLSQVIVRRGAQAMPVGDALPLRLPPNATRM
jgi:hypothetical protein